MKIHQVLKNAVFAVLVCGLLFFSACVSCKVCGSAESINSANKNDKVDMPEDFSFVKGKVWQLSKAADPSGAVFFDASKPDKVKFGDIYTLQFNDSAASGKAAPNRYRAPYELGQSGEISFKQPAGTLMLGIHTPEGLNESEFFKLLTKASRWSCKDNVLSVYTSDGDVLIFNEFDYR